jgi:hypothetical protein
MSPKLTIFSTKNRSFFRPKIDQKKAPKNDEKMLQKMVNFRPKKRQKIDQFFIKKTHQKMTKKSSKNASKIHQKFEKNRQNFDKKSKKIHNKKIIYNYHKIITINQVFNKKT